MDIRDRRGLRAEAHRVLQEAPSDPKKLILIHAGITAGVLLTATVLNILLGLWIDASVGLGGIGRRTVLATIQTMIQVCCNVALPFWEFGYFFAALRFAREQKADTNTLLSGFRHFGPVLRLSLLKALLFAGTGMASVYAGTMLYMMMPWGSSLMAAMEPVMQEAMRTGATEALSDQVTALIMAEAMPELLLVAGAIFLAIAAPIFYRLRFSEFALAEAPRSGALASMRISRRMLKGKCLALLRLDLSFWWFYLAEGVLAIVGYGDMLLLSLGIPLPMNEGVMFILCYALQLTGQLGLYYLARNQVMTTYAVAYREELLSQETAQVPAAQTPPKHPWTYE